MLDSLMQDIRFALRQLRKYPGFTAVVVLTLALGIGATTAIFSMVYAILLGDLPYPNGERMVMMRQSMSQRSINDLGVSGPEMRDYRAQLKSVDQVSEYHQMTFVLLGGEEPIRVRTGVVSAEYFPSLGLTPQLGRFFTPDEDIRGSEPVLVLGHDFWVERFGADPGIVGSHFEMNNAIHTVVGVLPPVPMYPQENDVWMPIAACPFRIAPNTDTNRRARMVAMYGRIAPDSSLEQVTAEAATAASRMAQANPEFYPEASGFNLEAVPLRDLVVSDETREMLLILLGASIFVLLIVCANVANLTLARVVRRDRELTLRAALGAERGRLLRQLLTESVILALVGGGLGLLLAYGVMDLLVAFAASLTPRAAEVGIHPPVLLFTLAISVLTGLIFGAVPAFTAKQELASALREGGNQSTASGGRRQARSIFTVVQLAVAFSLLVGAGLMLRSLWSLQAVDTGFDTERVLTLNMDLNWSRYGDNLDRITFYDTLLDRLHEIPGVELAAIAGTFPLNEQPAGNTNFQIEGRTIDPDQTLPSADFMMASPDYFDVLGVRLLDGRLFGPEDVSEAPLSVVVNKSLADAYFPDTSPIGQRMVFSTSTRTIVGVVTDFRQQALEVPAGPILFMPVSQFPSLSATVLIKTAGSPMALSQQVREAVYSIDAQQPVYGLTTLAAVRDDSMSSPRLAATLLGLSALLALTLTALGIGGLLAHSVAERTQEIGLRMALGADRNRVLGLVMRQGLRLALVGIVIGAVAAVALARVMESVVFGIQTRDPLTFVAVAAALLLVAVVACFLPARRATRIQPTRALHME